MSDVQKRQLAGSKLGCLLILTAMILPSPAVAQDDATRAAARTLGTEGVEAYQRGDYQSATKKLRQAYATLSVPSLALWLGRAEVKSGHLVSAAELFLEATRLPVSGSQADVQRQAQADAEEEREALLPRIPSLVILVTGADAGELKVDIGGTPVPGALIGAKRPTDPGTHIVTVTHGAEQVTRTVTLAEGATEQLEIDFSSEASAPVSPTYGGGSEADTTSLGSESPASSGPTRRTLGWVGVGVGGAALVGGGIFGALAIGQKSTLEDKCPDGVCPPAQHSAVDDYDRNRMISTVGLVVGVIAVGGGVTLLLTAPKQEDGAQEPKVAAWFGLGQAGVKGQF